MTVIRFSDVAYAIGATPKSLRNWLARDQVRLSSSQPESGWREFDLADIPKLALVRSIVAFGIDVRNADRIAEGVLAKGDLTQSAPPLKISLPGLGLEFEMRDFDAVLWPTEDGGDWNYTSFYLSADADRAITHAPASLVLRVCRIVMLALQRINERVPA